MDPLLSATDLAQRLNQLEEQCHRLNARARNATRLCASLAVLVVVAVAAGARRADVPKSLESEQFLLKSKDGRTTAVLETTEAGFPCLSMYDKTNYCSLQVCLFENGMPGICLGDRNHKGWINLMANDDGSTALHLYGQEGKQSLSLSLGADGASSVSLVDGNRKPRSQLGLRRDGSPYLELLNPRGKKCIVLGVDPDGSAAATISNSEGKPRVWVGVDEHRTSVLSLSNEDVASEVELRLTEAGVAAFQIYQGGQDRVTLGAPRDRPPVFTIGGLDGKKRLEFDVAAEGAPSLKLFRNDGKVILQLPASSAVRP
jgi:hypothetical protein